MKINKNSLSIPGTLSPILAPSVSNPVISHEQKTEGETGQLLAYLGACDKKLQGELRSVLNSLDSVDSTSVLEDASAAGLSNTPQNLTADLRSEFAKALNLDTRVFQANPSGSKIRLVAHLDYIQATGTVDYEGLNQLSQILGYYCKDSVVSADGLKIARYPGEKNPFTNLVTNPYRGVLLYSVLPEDDIQKVKSDGINEGFDQKDRQEIKFEYSKTKGFEERYNVAFSLPGRGLDAMALTPLLEARLLKKIHELGLHFTRIDVALSDYDNRVPFDKIIYAVRHKQFTNYQYCECIDSSVNEKGSGLFPTVYMGSGKSECSVRIYSMYPKHGVNGTRYEVQLRGSKAQQFVLGKTEYSNADTQNHLGLLCWCEPQYKDAPNDPRYKDAVNKIILESFVGVVVGAIDFIDKTGQYKNGSTSNLKRFDWWQKFLDLLKTEPIKLRRKKQVFDVHKTFDWLERTVSITLAAIRYMLGACEFERIIQGLVESAINDGRLEKHLKCNPSRLAQWQLLSQDKEMMESCMV